MTARLLPLQIVVALFLLLRLVMHVFGAPLGDETYYWYWGQHPDLSYYDHPPLHAWLLGVVSLFGWHQASIRILTWLTLAGTFWLFWLFAGRLAPDNRVERFWLSAAVYLASPLFFTMTLVSYHDHLLVLLCLGSAYALLVFAQGWERDAPRWAWLYLCAVLLGLAVLTKYNGVLFGIGLAVFVMLRPQLRSVLRNPHSWLAVLLSIAMQAPVLWWNMAHGLASYEFHLSTRWGGDTRSADWGAPLWFLLATALSLGPFLMWPLLKLLAGRQSDGGFAQSARVLAIATAATATLSFAGLSVFLGAYFYWNIVAFIAAMPLLAGIIGRRIQLWAHLSLGLLFAALLVFNFSIAPIAPLLGGRDGGSAVNFGWDRVKTEVQAVLDAHPGAALAGTRYSNATQIGFALRQPDVTALSVERDQFDYWFDAEAHAGKNFVVLADANDGAEADSYLRAHFDTLSEVASIPVVRLGVEVFSFRVLVAEGYRPTQNN